MSFSISKERLKEIQHGIKVGDLVVPCIITRDGVGLYGRPLSVVEIGEDTTWPGNWISCVYPSNKEFGRVLKHSDYVFPIAPKEIIAAGQGAAVLHCMLHYSLSEEEAKRLIKVTTTFNEWVKENDY